MGKYNEQPTSGKGGEFRVEKNDRYPGQGEGSAASLKRFGSLAECITRHYDAGTSASKVVDRSLIHLRRDRRTEIRCNYPKALNLVGL